MSIVFLLFFICVFEIHHKCLKRNRESTRPSPINSNVKSAFVEKDSGVNASFLCSECWE